MPNSFASMCIRLPERSSIPRKSIGSSGFRVASLSVNSATRRAAINFGLFFPRVAIRGGFLSNFPR